MARRTGVPTTLKVAIRLCSLLSKYGPVIAALYPANASLLAALAAAQTACSALSQELAVVREMGD